MWDLEQIQQAVKLGLGVQSTEQIELIVPNTASQRIVDTIRPFITA